MRWPPNVLAHALVKAGCPAAQLPHGIAVAMATSDGDDAWRWLADLPGTESYLGCWGVPGSWLAEHPNVAPYVLADSAMAATALLSEHGDWSWSISWRAGGWRAWLDVATTAATAPAAGFVPKGPANPDLAGLDTAGLRSGVARVIDGRDAALAYVVQRPPI